MSDSGVYFDFSLEGSCQVGAGFGLFTRFFLFSFVPGKQKWEVYGAFASLLSWAFSCGTESAKSRQIVLK